MAIVELDEIAPLWPGGSIPDQARATALLPLVEATMAARVPRLYARIADNTLDRYLLVLAVYRVLSRALADPADGSVQQISETAGPFTQSRTFRDVASQSLVSDADIADLLPLDERPGASSWGSVGMGLEAWQLPDRPRSWWF